MNAERRSELTWSSPIHYSPLKWFVISKQLDSNSRSDLYCTVNVKRTCKFRDIWGMQLQGAFSCGLTEWLESRAGREPQGRKLQKSKSCCNCRPVPAWEQLYLWSAIIYHFPVIPEPQRKSEHLMVENIKVHELQPEKAKITCFSCLN